MSDAPVTVDRDALLGALVAMRRLDSDARKEVTRATRSVLAPAWKNQLARHAATPASPWPGQGKQAAMLGKGRARVTTGGALGAVAWTGRPLSGGLDEWRMLEFGGKSPTLPDHVRKGRIAYPAAADFKHTAAKTWLRAIADACRAIPGAEDGSV